MNIKDKIIIALDVNSLKEEERLLDILSPHVNVFKVGMELFYSCGAKAVDIVKKYDRDVFLDLKFHDIPNTVKSASRAAVRLGVYMFNVHASGGSDMMKSALEGAEEESQILGIGRPLILGVTVLTSIDEACLKSTGINKTPQEQVMHLAKLAKDAGLDGVVASPKETKLIRDNIPLTLSLPSTSLRAGSPEGRGFVIVTPGIRLEDSQKDDQKRTATPQEAFQKGADYIVIGRPVIKAKDPVKAIQEIKI
jgi:orotidine-5'-phosphate decarboxylase